jgi:hypothetical protein
MLVTHSLPRILTRCGPRIDQRLVAAIARLDDPTLPIAETNRRLGVVAAGLGLLRPSYHQVRVIVHELRAQKRSSRPGEVLLEIAYGMRTQDQILRVLAGVVASAVS